MGAVLFGLWYVASSVLQLVCRTGHDVGECIDGSRLRRQCPAICRFVNNEAFIEAGIRTCVLQPLCGCMQ